MKMIPSRRRTTQDPWSQMEKKVTVVLICTLSEMEMIALATCHWLYKKSQWPVKRVDIEVVWLERS